jgi:signal-transduction protein with cAMP-binding, CBS, and nucleotidyltransferase domain
MQIRDAIRKNPVTIEDSASLADAADVMNVAAVGCLVVTDDGQPVGMVTDRDLVVRAMASNMGLDTPVEAVMSTDLVTVDAGADLRSVLSVFRNHPIRRLPVMDHGALVGVITLDDLIMDLSADLCDLARAVTGQVVFGHAEPLQPV